VSDYGRRRSEDRWRIARHSHAAATAVATGRKAHRHVKIVPHRLHGATAASRDPVVTWCVVQLYVASSNSNRASLPNAAQLHSWHRPFTSTHTCKCGCMGRWPNSVVMLSWLELHPREPNSPLRSAHHHRKAERQPAGSGGIRRTAERSGTTVQCHHKAG